MIDETEMQERMKRVQDYLDKTREHFKQSLQDAQKLYDDGVFRGGVICGPLATDREKEDEH